MLNALSCTTPDRSPSFCPTIDPNDSENFHQSFRDRTKIMLKNIQYMKKKVLNQGPTRLNTNDLTRTCEKPNSAFKTNLAFASFNNVITSVSFILQSKKSTLDRHFMFALHAILPSIIYRRNRLNFVWGEKLRVSGRFRR